MRKFLAIISAEAGSTSRSLLPQSTSVGTSVALGISRRNSRISERQLCGYLNRMLEDSWSSQRKGIAAQGFGCDPRRVPIHPSHKLAMQETSTVLNRWELQTYSGQAERCQPLPPDARPGVRRRNQHQRSSSRWLKCRSLRAVVPPYELPIKSQQEIPMVSRNLDNRCAAATNRASSPSGLSGNPGTRHLPRENFPGLTTMGIADRQLREHPVARAPALMPVPGQNVEAPRGHPLGSSVHRRHRHFVPRWALFY